MDVSDAQLLSVTGGELSLRQFETNQNVTIYGSYDGLTFRATLVIRAKGNTDEDRYVDLLRENPDITIERIV